MPSITSNLTTFANYSVNTMSVGSKNNWYWTNPSDAQTDNNVYAKFEWHDPNSQPVYAVGQSDVLDARQLVTTVPSGATIDGIMVTLRAFNSLYGTFDINDDIRLLKNGSVITHPATAPTYLWSLTETVQTYGGATDLWGTTWTDTDINGSGFGVSTLINISLTSGGDPPINPSISNIDQIYVTIYYTGGSSATAQTINPYSVSVIGGQGIVTLKSVTNIAANSIWAPTPSTPKPTIKSAISTLPSGLKIYLPSSIHTLKSLVTARPSGLSTYQPRNLTSLKSVTGIRVTGLKTLDFTQPTIASVVGIRLSSIKAYDVVGNTNLYSNTNIRPTSIATDLPKNNHRILASTVISPSNFTTIYDTNLSIPASTKIFHGSISSNYYSQQTILGSTVLFPTTVKEVKSISTANILSSITANVSGLQNVATVSSFRLTNKFYDTFSASTTINFGDTADYTWSVSSYNYSRTTTAGTKVVAYQCIFDKGDDFYVQGLVKTDNGYTTSGLSGIGFGIQPSNKNYGYFAVIDVRNGSGGNSTHSLQLRKVDATGTTILASYNATGLIKADTWYRIYAYWNNTTGITVYFNEKEGTPIGSPLTSTDSTFTSGYDGFTSFSNTSFDNLTNIPRQYVDITDGGIKPAYGFGLPSLSQGVAAIRPSSITIDNIGTVRLGSQIVVYPRIVPDLNKIGSVTIAKGPAIIIPSSVNISNLGSPIVLGGFGIQPRGLGIYNFGLITLRSGGVSILPTSIDYNKQIIATIKANINVIPSSIVLSKIIGQIQVTGVTAIRPNGLKALDLGTISVFPRNTNLTPSGIDLNKIGNITIKANININPSNFTRIIPPIGIIIKANTNIVPNKFTFDQIGNVNILSSTAIRPTSFTRIVSPSLNITSLINILPGTINAGALGNITFKSVTAILPSGLKVYQITGISNLSSVTSIVPSGLSTRNIGTITLKALTNILPNGILSNFPITNILINRQEKIIPAGANNSKLGIITLVINTNIRPSGYDVLKLGNITARALNTNIIPNGLYTPNIGNIFIFGDNAIRPSGINLLRIGLPQLLGGPRTIYPSSINLVSVVRLNLQVNTNIIPSSITSLGIPNTTITAKTNINPSGIKLFDRINLSITGVTSVIPSGILSYPVVGTIRITGNTNIIPSNFTVIKPPINIQIKSSTIIYPNSILDSNRVSSLLRITGGTSIIPSGLPMPIILNLHRMLSSVNIIPSSIFIRNAPIGISIKSNIIASLSSIYNLSNFGNIRLTNRFYDTFKTDRTINFGDLADITYNSVDLNYNRTTTAGTKVVAYQCIFDKADDFYVQGLVKSDDGYTTSSLAGIGFGIQPSNKNYGYFAVVDVRNGTGGNTTHSLQLRRVDATGTTILASYNATGLIKANTWYRIYAFWNNTSGISVYFNEKEGTPIGITLTSTDTTFTSGYDGFTSFSNASFDNLTNIIRQYVNVTDGGINYQVATGTPSLLQGAASIRPSSITIDKIGLPTLTGRIAILPSSMLNLTKIGTITILRGVATILPNSIFLPRTLGFVNVLGGGGIQPPGTPPPGLGNITILAGPRVITPSGQNLTQIGNIILKVNTNIIPNSIKFNKNDIGNITIVSRTVITPNGLPALDIGNITIARGGINIIPVGLPIQKTGNITILSSAVIYPGNFTRIVPPTGIIIKSITAIQPSGLKTTPIGNITILSSALIQPRNFTNIQGPRNISILGLTVIQPSSIILGNNTNIGLITVVTGQSPIRPSAISVSTGLTGIRILSLTNIIPGGIKSNDIPGIITIKSITAIRPSSVSSLTAIGQITILSSTIIYQRPIPDVKLGNFTILGGLRLIQPTPIDITQPPTNIIINSATAIRPGSIRGIAGQNNIVLLTFKNIIPGSINLPNNIGNVIIKASTTIRPGSITVIDPTFGTITIRSSIVIYPGSIRLNTNNIGSIILAKPAFILPGLIKLPDSQSNIIIGSKTIIYPETIAGYQSFRYFPYFAYNPLAGIPIYIYVYGLNEPTTPFFYNVGNVRIAAETKILPASIQSPVKYQIGSVSIKSITAIQPASLNKYEVTNLHTIRAGTIVISPASVVIKPNLGLVTILASTVIRPSSITLGNTNSIGQIRFNASTNILPSGIKVYEITKLHLLKPGPIIIQPYTIRYNDTLGRVTIKAVNTIIVRPVPDQHRIGDIIIKSVTAIIPKSIGFIRIGRHKILMSTTPGSIYSYYEMIETIEDDIELVEMGQVLEEFDSSIESDIR